MIVIRKSHDDIGETGDIANIANFASANFYIVCCPACHAVSDFVFLRRNFIPTSPPSFESLVIPWRFLGGSLVVTLPKAYPNRT